MRALEERGAVSFIIRNSGRTQRPTTAIIAPGAIAQPVRSTSSWASKGVRPPKIAVAPGRAQREAGDPPFAGELLGGGDGADRADPAGKRREHQRADQRLARASRWPSARTWSIGKHGAAERQQRPAPAFGPTRSDRIADERRDEDDHHRGDGRQPQRRLLAQRPGRGQEGRDVGDADIISDRAQRRDGEGAADRAAMIGEAVAERAVGNGLLGGLWR